MTTYVDGFMLPLPLANVERYRALAEVAREVWREHGALAYHECIGDDLDAEGMVSFRTLAQCGPDETVMFSWAIFASKEARDAANAKIMQDQRLKDSCDPDAGIFDYRRMAFGGFRTLVSG